MAASRQQIDSTWQQCQRCSINFCMQPWCIYQPITVKGKSHQHCDRKMHSITAPDKDHSTFFNAWCSEDTGQQFGHVTHWLMQLHICWATSVQPHSSSITFECRLSSHPSGSKLWPYIGCAEKRPSSAFSGSVHPFQTAWLYIRLFITSRLCTSPTSVLRWQQYILIICNAPTLGHFKTALKTHLFRISYHLCTWVLISVNLYHCK